MYVRVCVCEFIYMQIARDTHTWRRQAPRDTTQVVLHYFIITVYVFLYFPEQR